MSRRPVGTATVPIDGKRRGTLYVVCDDGSTWFLNEDGDWVEGEPVPGTPADSEEGS